MKNIVPIFALIISVCAFCMSALCLGLMIFISYPGLPPALAAFAIPCLVTDTVVTALSAGINFFFLKSKICRAGFVVSLVSVAFIVAAFIVMFLL